MLRKIIEKMFVFLFFDEVFRLCLNYNADPQVCGSASIFTPGSGSGSRRKKLSNKNRNNA